MSNTRLSLGTAVRDPNNEDHNILALIVEKRTVRY